MSDARLLYCLRHEWLDSRLSSLLSLDRRRPWDRITQVRALVSQLEQKLTTANLKLFTHECATKSAENRTMDANVRGEETNYQRSRLHQVYDQRGQKAAVGAQ